MLTQIQIVEPQAVLPAACPRPRALVFTAPPVAAWPVGAPIAASARRFAAVESVRPLGFAGAERSAGVARGERGFGYGAAAALVVPASGTSADGPATAPISMTSVNQQDKQHLTASREPVTWRPPH